MRVLWKNERGFSDLATVALAADRKTVLWNSTSPVPLLPGINHVRIRALGQPDAAFVNVFYAPQTPAAVPVLKTTILQGKQITYEVRDGLAIYQSDMVLRKAGAVHPNSVTIGPNFLSASGLWPIVNGVARVPYTIANVNAANTSNVNAAITESNTQLTGVVQWEPASSSDVNVVNFDFDPTNLSGACEADVGMIGGPQTIGGSINCTTTTILHEMGHALGLYHEQSRVDRNSYVNYMEQNIDKPNHGNFDIIGSSSVASGLYNYASIMEYGPFSFNKDGVSPTLETIPAGMVLGTDLPEYTSGDLDGIMRLYAHAPSAITVDTNPSGLKVIVDGTTCTAPCVFSNWTIGSEHTLNVPPSNGTLQTLNKQDYIFGRWNAGAQKVQEVMVTNSAGNGTLLSPKTSPAITNYLASFIAIHPYSPVVSPSSSDGTISASPLPSSISINGTPLNYYEDRQLVTFKVTPKAGFNFDFWANVPLFNLYSNPFTFYITSNFDSSYNGSPTTAVLVSDAVTTITAASPDTTATGLAPGVSPGFAIGVVDGKGHASTAYTPVNFDATFNGAGFASGEKVTFSTTAVQSPVTKNVSYQFSDWTGAGTPSGDSLGVVVAASGQSKSTANYKGSFRSIVEPSLFCPNSSYDNELMVTASPSGTSVNPLDKSDGDLDAFFSAGTVDFTAVKGSTGLSFAGWSQDLASGGTTSPFAFPLTGQVLATANFNISGSAPLTISSVSPVTVSKGAVNLTVTGTGFSTTSSTLYTYYVDPKTGYYMYRSNTPTPAGSSTETVVHLNAGDVATAGYYQIVVLNAVTTGCNPSAVTTFSVANSAGPPALGITKSHVGSFSKDQHNAQYTVLVSNIGKGATVDPVTVTETIPSGETLVSMSGWGWTCASGGNSCTRSDSLAPAMSYGAITVTVNVAANASSPQVNAVTVSGGGAPSATATDSTIISSQATVPNVVGDTQSAATTAIQNAGLVVGTVTKMSSGTVAAGDAISENPAAGTVVSAGSAVNLVVSSGPAGPPAVVSVSPSSGTGLTQTFTAVYSDPKGAADLSSVRMLFNTSLSGGSGCYLIYYPGSNAFYLENNADSATVGPLAPGSSATISNSQCTLAGTGTSVSTSGNNMTVKFALTFSSTFDGSEKVYMGANSASAASGWVQEGTWTP
jgi:astacin